LVGELSLTQIVPAAMAYQQRCMVNLRLQKELGMNAKSSASLKVLAETIAQHISAMVEQTEKMRLARKKSQRNRFNPRDGPGLLRSSQAVPGKHTRPCRSPGNPDRQRVVATPQIQGAALPEVITSGAA